MSSKVQSGGLDSDSRKFVSEIHQEGSFFLMTALAEKMPLALERLLLLWRAAALMCCLIYQIRLKATYQLCHLDNKSEKGSRKR